MFETSWNESIRIFSIYFIFFNICGFFLEIMLTFVPNTHLTCGNKRLLLVGR